MKIIHNPFGAPLGANPSDLFIEAEASEIWRFTMPRRGDHIRVRRLDGLYCHHGIYVSDDEVIHFTGEDDDSVLDWSKAKVISTSLERFLRGGEVEVKEYNDEEIADLYPVDGIVNYARSCLGDGGYDLIFNNCEHFANACTLGKYRSRQVDDISNTVLGGKKMGLWEAVKGFFGFGQSSSSSSGNRTTENYNYNYDYKYEPDKVRAAEIAAETARMEAALKLKLADKEAERIELARDAWLDLTKAQTMSQIAIEEAKAKGFAERAAQLAALQEKLLGIAEKRLAIIEHGALPIVREIESFYREIGERIEHSQDEYNTKKLPQLLSLLKEYEPGSAEHEIYQQQINDDRARQNEYAARELGKVGERQAAVLDSFLRGKENLIRQSGELTEKIAAVSLAAATEAKERANAKKLPQPSR